MFNPIEKKFLRFEIENYIKRTRVHLSTDMQDEERELVEHSLMIAITILNKLACNPSNELVKPKPTRVLVVDDIKSMRELNKQMLLAIGFIQVELAIDGQQALHILNSAEKNGNPFGLVLSDWEMPLMTGLELLKEIRMSTNLMSTPVFLLTGLSNKKNIMDAISLGVTGYMVKPINQNMLHCKLKDFLTSH